MSDWPAQVAFFDAFCRWGIAAKARGYAVTFGDGYRDPRATFPYATSGEKSFHARRLAHDVNLFKDGAYLVTLPEWEATGLGALWERLGGTWGGHWSDPNHLSWGEGHRCPAQNADT